MPDMTCRRSLIYLRRRLIHIFTCSRLTSTGRYFTASSEYIRPSAVQLAMPTLISSGPRGLAKKFDLCRNEVKDKISLIILLGHNNYKRSSNDALNELKSDRFSPQNTVNKVG